MATIGFRLAYGDSEVRSYPEAASQSFALGDLVYLNAGKVTIGTDSTKYIGVALKAASTTTDTEIPVQLIKPGSVWVAEFDTTSAVAYVGVDYGLNFTSGSMGVDQGDESTTHVTVVDNIDVGVSPYLVLVAFHNDTSQWVNA
jgi:hypothetical protein